MQGSSPVAGSKAVMAVTSSVARDLAHKKKGPAHRRASLSGDDASLVHPGPGLAAAEHAAEGAALHAQCIGAPHRDRRIIGAAGVGIEDPAAPLLVLAGPHVDQDLLAIRVRLGVDRIAAEIGAA